MCRNSKLLDDAYGQKTENGRLNLIFGTFGTVYTNFDISQQLTLFIFM